MTLPQKSESKLSLLGYLKDIFTTSDLAEWKQVKLVFVGTEGATLLFSSA